MIGYDAANPTASTMPIPAKNIALNKDAPINPGIKKTTVFSANSIAEMLAVSPSIATLAACFNDSVLSIGIMVNVYPVTNANPTAITIVVIISKPRK